MSWVVEALAPYLGEPAGYPSNGNYPYCCPFHGDGQESKPSFFLHGDLGVAFCHACNQGWNLPQLLKKLGAGHKLITIASRMLGEEGRRRRKGRSASASVTPLPEEVMGILLERGPADLLTAGFDRGVLLEHEVGFDPFEHIAVYPIRDHLGRLVALSGRYPEGYFLYGKDQLRQLIIHEKFRPPKEVHKSHYLWNLHRLYPALFHGDVASRVVVVEGFKACLWCIQHGYPYTVALMGSSLSEEQARLLERITNRVVLFLDRDRAGANGTDAALERLRGSMAMVYLAQYPRERLGKLQPDSLSRHELMAAIEESRPYYRRTQ